MTHLGTKRGWIQQWRQRRTVIGGVWNQLAWTPSRTLLCIWVFISESEGKVWKFLKGYLTILYVSDVHVLLEKGALTEQKDILTDKVIPGHRADNRPWAWGIEDARRYMLWGNPHKEWVHSSKGHPKFPEEGLGFNLQVKAVLCFHANCLFSVSGTECSV